MRRTRAAGRVSLDFAGLYIVLKIFNLCAGQGSLAPDAMFWAYVAAEAWGRYRAGRGRGLLTAAVLSAAVSALSLACYVMTVLWRR